MPHRSEVLRAEAARCLDMAKLVSFEPHRQSFLDMAARCSAEATAIEEALLAGKQPAPAASPPCTCQDPASRT